MATATTAYRAAKLEVPGGQLYYEVRGAGPTLLLMPGGPADATTFRQIENVLAERYTVVTYDPRGLSHSSDFGPRDDERMVEIFADDAYRLLRATGDGKAYVFASSGGASIALELALAHPDEIEVIVAHEPPSPDLQPEPAAIRAAMEDVCDTCASEGMWPAAAKFIRLCGIEGGPPPQAEGEPTPEMLEAMAMMQRNMQFFFSRYIRNLARHRLDLEALRACSCPIVAAVGTDSAGQLAHVGGLNLARALGTGVTVFPGDHGGFAGRPVDFAARLLEVLGAERSGTSGA